MSEIGPGTIVQCVRADFPARVDEIVPTLGSVYTVREVITFSCGAGIRLAEIINPPQRYIEGFQECAFFVDFFRPLPDSRLDIFRELAEDPKQPVLVPA